LSGSRRCNPTQKKSPQGLSLQRIVGQHGRRATVYVAILEIRISPLKMKKSAFLCERRRFLTYDFPHNAHMRLIQIGNATKHQRKWQVTEAPVPRCTWVPRPLQVHFSYRATRAKVCCVHASTDPPGHGVSHHAAIHRRDYSRDAYLRACGRR
jgi:hypothetical protein